jgi:isopropylmalate/homocitrate/citramalate synthase
MTWQNARIAAFGSTRHRANRPEQDPNLAALVEARTPVITIFGKSWLLHVTEVLGATADENLAMVEDSVAFCRQAGKVEVVYDAEHFFDGYKADRDYALATLRAAHAAGAGTLALCDTNGGCMTDEVAPSWLTSSPRSISVMRSATTSTSTPADVAEGHQLRSAPACVTSRAPSTATASAAATPTS